MLPSAATRVALQAAPRYGANARHLLLEAIGLIAEQPGHQVQPASKGGMLLQAKGGVPCWLGTNWPAL